MAFDVVNEGGVTFVEGAPGTTEAATGEGISTAIIESCFGAGAQGALIYAEQLPAAFFDLSSRMAGEVFQRLRNYGLRLAVVVPPGWRGGSSRFGEMVAEEQRGRDFGLFESRADAVKWLAA